jgi:transposase
MSTNKVGWQGKTPSIELRQQVVAARLAGKTPREVTEITGLSVQTQARYLRKFKTGALLFQLHQTDLGLATPLLK